MQAHCLHTHLQSTARCINSTIELHLVCGQLVYKGAKGGGQRIRQIIHHGSVALPGEQHLEVGHGVRANRLVLEASADVAMIEGLNSF